MTDIASGASGMISPSGMSQKTLPKLKKLIIITAVVWKNSIQIIEDSFAVLAMYNAKKESTCIGMKGVI